MLVVLLSARSNKNKEGNGGAIRTEIKTDIFVENSRFMSNQANVNGGAIYSKGKLDVHNSTFGENAATMVRASAYIYIYIYMRAYLCYALHIAGI